MPSSLSWIRFRYLLHGGGRTHSSHLHGCAAPGLSLAIGSPLSLSLIGCKVFNAMTRPVPIIAMVSGSLPLALVLVVSGSLLCSHVVNSTGSQDLRRPPSTVQVRQLPSKTGAIGQCWRHDTSRCIGYGGGTGGATLITAQVEACHDRWHYVGRLDPYSRLASARAVLSPPTSPRNEKSAQGGLLVGEVCGQLSARSRRPCSP
ncbi:hypothetical protein DyAD56_16305 [Dyella sp. AD56]|nr:hypothetical protein DyAD56_16305 [Dyella sp. AD56]